MHLYVECSQYSTSLRGSQEFLTGSKQPLLCVYSPNTHRSRFSACDLHRKKKGVEEGERAGVIVHSGPYVARMRPRSSPVEPFAPRDNRLFPTFLQHAKLVSGPIYPRPASAIRTEHEKSTTKAIHYNCISRASERGHVGPLGGDNGESHLHFCNNQRYRDLSVLHRA